MHPELTRIVVEDRQARLRADYAASRRNAAAWRAFVLRLRRVLGWALVDAGIRIAAGRVESSGVSCEYHPGRAIASAPSQSFFRLPNEYD
jgi:hypothetical protein